MASRAWPKLYVMAHAAPRVLLGGRRTKPHRVRRLLVAHHLLLGDTIMLTPLLKKARARFPDAEIVMTVPRAYAPLYAGRPYGIDVLPFDQRSLRDHMTMRRQGGFDLALVPGDNRWSWLARTLQAKWVVAFASDEHSYKDVPVDELVPLPQEPLAWGDIATRLLEGDAPSRYRPDDWPPPPFHPYARPQHPYGVLHLGASSAHKLWPADRWRAVVEWAERKGYAVVLSTGRGEERLLPPVDKEGQRSALAGTLDLAQLFDLLRNASFLVSPDTGTAHLARLVNLPSVVIYGPGSPVSAGPGDFWRDSPVRSLWDQTVHCRDQDRLFERKLVWLRQCWRSVAECGDPFCVRRITAEQVMDALGMLLDRR